MWHACSPEVSLHSSGHCCLADRNPFLRLVRTFPTWSSVVPVGSPWTVDASPLIISRRWLVETTDRLKFQSQESRQARLLFQVHTCACIRMGRTIRPSTQACIMISIIREQERQSTPRTSIIESTRMDGVCAAGSSTHEIDFLRRWQQRRWRNSDRWLSRVWWEEWFHPM